MSRPSSSSRRRARSRIAPTLVAAGVGAAGLATAVVLVLAAVGRFNPFPTQVSEADDAVVLTQVQDLARFQAATGRFQTIVDQRRTSEVVPSWVSGERTVLAAEGDVDAAVDFSGLPSGAVDLSSDGTHATVHLPPPTLGQPRLDAEATRVISRDRGVVDRLGDAVGDQPDATVDELEARATEKLADAASQSDLTERARVNTERFLTETLRASGVQSVTVVFDQRAPGAAA